MKNVAIITARGGSKRIPRKNIKNFCGKPIIAYSIQAAIESRIFDEVMVSTDDAEIASIATKTGALVPFMRSSQTSNDHATTADVIFEVLGEYNKQSKNFDMFCCLYPTAPFITAEKLKQAFEKLKKSDAETLVPVVRFSFPIQRAMQIDNARLTMIQPEHMNSRSQDLKPSFHDCGQFYFGRVAPFLKNKKLFSNNTLAFEMPELEVQDIDNEQDWKIAELKYEFMKKNV